MKGLLLLVAALAVARATVVFEEKFGDGAARRDRRQRLPAPTPPRAPGRALRRAAAAGGRGGDARGRLCLRARDMF